MTHSLARMLSDLDQALISLRKKERFFQAPYLEVQSPSSQHASLNLVQLPRKRENPGPGEGRLGSIRIPMLLLPSLFYPFVFIH